MNGIRTRIAFLGAAAVLFALVLTAAAGAGSRSAAAPAVKEGGTVVVGLTAGEPDALDPTLARTFSGREVFLTFCEKLYDLNTKAQIVPQLASALPTISKDKLTVTIPLRTGIKFNDNTPFNAEAVVKTLQRDQTLKGSARASEISPIDSVTASGANKVVIHLKTPYSPLTAQFADRSGMILSPAAIDKLGDKFATGPVCVGPFMYDSRVAGDSITVVKSPYYYNKKNVHLAKIVFKVQNDAAAAAAALKAGDLQALDGTDSTQLQGIKATKSLRVIKQTGLGYQGLTLNIGNKNGLLKQYTNVGTPIAANADLRKAFEMAIDRKAMNKIVFGGTVLPGCTPLSPSSAWFDASVKCTPFNVAAAKKLVASSGVANPTVHLMVPTGSVALRQAQFLQAEEEAVGIKVVIDSTDFVTSLSKADAGTYETFQVGWSGRVDPDGDIYQFVHTTGSQNDSGYSNPRLDLILNNARKAATEKARKTLYRAAQKIMLNDRPLIYLYHPVTRASLATSLTGVSLYPDTLLRVAFAAYK
ncbi:MAG: peptide/nickel transport system substrate-binding protein [Gaiellaceae bacterium]|jgi:peptide/nickel transport system substrate-binding protein|nr:peptide/nickel transport system substrate-binding protein [Gaiellaceae bacterium]